MTRYLLTLFSSSLFHVIDMLASGVSHGDELTYMFYMPRQRDRNLFAMTRKDYDMVNMVTLIWSNFAKTG